MHLFDILDAHYPVPFDIFFLCSIIKKGQKAGLFRDGNAVLLSRCFWASVQGVMEEMAMDKDMKAPDREWFMAMLKK